MFWIKCIRYYFKRRLMKFEEKQKAAGKWTINLENVRALCSETYKIFVFLTPDIYSSHRTLVAGYENIEALALHYRYIIDWLDGDLKKSYDYKNRELVDVYLRDLMLDSNQCRVELWMVLKSLNQLLDVVDEGLKMIPPAQQGVVKRALSFPLTTTFSTLEALISLALVDETKFL